MRTMITLVLCFSIGLTLSTGVCFDFLSCFLFVLLLCVVVVCACVYLIFVCEMCFFVCVFFSLLILLLCVFICLFVYLFKQGAGRSSEVERSLMVRWVVGSILHGVDPLNYFTFQPVLHDWCNKGRGMCYPVCGMVHIKEHLLLMWRQRVSLLTIRMVLNHISDAI